MFKAFPSIEYLDGDIAMGMAEKIKELGDIADYSDLWLLLK